MNLLEILSLSVCRLIIQNSEVCDDNHSGYPFEFPSILPPREYLVRRDVCSNPPRFIGDNTMLRVREDAIIGTRVYQVRAVDGDTNVATPRRIQYTIVDDNKVSINLKKSFQ
jgi:hypothetical protein